MYDHWFSQYTWNMSFADAGTIKIPDLKQNAVHFDARTCEFLNKKSEAHYFCSSSILDWDRSYKGCRFLDRVIEVERSQSGVQVFLWEMNFLIWQIKNTQNLSI